MANESKLTPTQKNDIRVLKLAQRQELMALVDNPVVRLLARELIAAQKDPKKPPIPDLHSWEFVGFCLTQFVEVTKVEPLFTASVAQAVRQKIKALGGLPKKSQIHLV